MTVTIDESRCTGCGICALACPANAITTDRVAKIDEGACRGCGICVTECPNEALSWRRTETSAPSQGHVPSPRRPVFPLRPTGVPVPPVVGGQARFRPPGGSGGILEAILGMGGWWGGHGGRCRGRGGARGRGKRGRP